MAKILGLDEKENIKFFASVLWGKFSYKSCLPKAAWKPHGIKIRWVVFKANLCCKNPTDYYNRQAVFPFQLLTHKKIRSQS